MRARLRALAPLDVPVLFSGEPGSGRVAAARALHALSGARAPLIEVRGPEYALPGRGCSALLLDLEAWPRGAQDAWASAARPGGGGEIGRLFTIASAALAVRVDRGELRRDLWMRLARFRIDMPPLRERARDIPTFAREAVAHATAALGRPSLPITRGALASLQKRPWPGNLPELREVAVQAVAFAQRGRIDREEIDRALEAVIAAREDSLAQRRAQRHSSERDELVVLLGACGGNVAEIARRLGMTRGAVAYRLRKHGLTP